MLETAAFMIPGRTVRLSVITSLSLRTIRGQSLSLSAFRLHKDISQLVLYVAG